MIYFIIFLGTLIFYITFSYFSFRITRKLDNLDDLDYILICLCEKYNEIHYDNNISEFDKSDIIIDYIVDCVKTNTPFRFKHKLDRKSIIFIITPLLNNIYIENIDINKIPKSTRQKVLRRYEFIIAEKVII